MKEMNKMKTCLSNTASAIYADVQKKWIKMKMMNLFYLMATHGFKELLVFQGNTYALTNLTVYSLL